MKRIYLLVNMVFFGLTFANMADAATIVVVGQSEVETMPDMATLTIDVRNRNKDAAKAQATNVDQVKKLMSKINAVGLKTSEMRTSNYQFARDAKSDSEGNIIELGFYADTTIVIETPHFELLPQIVAIAVMNGATNVGDASYWLSDDTAVVDKARSIAFQNADQEAKKAATAVRSTLGPISKIAVGAAAIANMMAGIEGGLGGGRSAKYEVANAPADIAPNLTVDMVKVQYFVTIEYELK